MNKTPTAQPDQISRLHAEVLEALPEGATSRQRYAVHLLATAAHDGARDEPLTADLLAEVRKLAANAAPTILEVEPGYLDDAKRRDALQASLEGQNVVLLERGGPVRAPGTTDLANVPTRADTGALDRAVGEAVGKMMGGLGIDQADLRGELTDLYDLVADTLATWATGLAEQNVDDEDELPPIEDRPLTPHGVSLYFADGTTLDVDNIEGLRVYEKDTHRFPFGFMPQTLADDEDVEQVTYRAGYYRPEDGEFVPFTADQSPNPYDSWGG